MKKRQSSGSKETAGADFLKEVRFDAAGLVPAIIQDDASGDVLMMAYMSRTALEKTLETGLTHFWSRSRKKLWQKGETSGHVQRVRTVRLDCDEDALLIRVQQTEVACHTGRWSCFFHKLENGGWIVSETATKGGRGPILNRVYDIILDRKAHPKEDSYVSSLLAKGKDRILRKIGEEAGELIIGSKNNRKAEIISEMADLWFHTLVLLGYHGITPQDIYQELEQRFGKPARKK